MSAEINRLFSDPDSLCTRPDGFCAVPPDDRLLPLRKELLEQSPGSLSGLKAIFDKRGLSRTIKRSEREINALEREGHLCEGCPFRQFTDA